MAVHVAASQQGRFFGIIQDLNQLGGKNLHDGPVRLPRTLLSFVDCGPGSRLE